MADCGGIYVVLENGWKDCSRCFRPHEEDGYDYIINRLKNQNKRINTMDELKWVADVVRENEKVSLELLQEEISEEIRAACVGGALVDQEAPIVAPGVIRLSL